MTPIARKRSPSRKTYCRPEINVGHGWCNAGRSREVKLSEDGKDMSFEPEHGHDECDTREAPSERAQCPYLDKSVPEVRIECQHAEREQDKRKHSDEVSHHP